MQEGYRGGQKGCVSCTLLFILGEGIVYPEVSEVWEVSNEIQDLSTRASGFFEGKELKCWGEVPKALLDDWHKAGYLEEIYSEFLEICQCREVTQRTPAKVFGSELGSIYIIQADLESFKEWKQTKLV